MAGSCRTGRGTPCDADVAVRIRYTGVYVRQARTRAAAAIEREPRGARRLASELPPPALRDDGDAHHGALGTIEVGIGDDGLGGWPGGELRPELLIGTLHLVRDLREHLQQALAPDAMSLRQRSGELDERAVLARVAEPRGCRQRGSARRAHTVPRWTGTLQIRNSKGPFPLPICSSLCFYPS